MTDRTAEHQRGSAWECTTRELRLRKGMIWSNAGISGRLTIECVEGTAWITEEGVSEDIILEPGGCCMPSIGTLLVIESLTDYVLLRLEEWLAEGEEQDEPPEERRDG